MTACLAKPVFMLVATFAAAPSAAEETFWPASARSGVASNDYRASVAQNEAATLVEPPLMEHTPVTTHETPLPDRAIISIGPQAVAGGKPRYAVRANVAGSALVVSFSSNPTHSFRPAGALPFLLPTTGRLTGAFGWRTDPMHGATRFHAGVDLASQAGSPIRATQNGSVASAGWSGNYGYLVVLDHGNGVETRYAHMSAISVEAGRSVQQGDIIGLVGSSGRSTGPHVHYEVRIDGRATNPLPR